jgi:glyoxylase-like metal-dependent hydrolase (beta-lactamase superfamily II)
MFIDRPGKICDGLYMLGLKQSLMYLVQGQKSMIMGGAMNWIVPQLEQQFKQFAIDTDSIEYLVIPHAHFDHFGAVPYLKRRFPQIKVLGTEAAVRILSKEKVINYSEMVNKLMIDTYKLQEEYERMNLKIDAVTIDQVVNNSTVIDLGNGLEARFIETPGHSPSDVTVYVPGLKAIFPSDAVPCPLGSINKLARPSPQYDFTLYKESITKLLPLDIEICCFDHYAAVTGADARQVLANAVKLCGEYQDHIVEQYRLTGDLEQVAGQAARETLENESFDFLNEELMMPISRAEVRNVLKSAGLIGG